MHGDEFLKTSHASKPKHSAFSPSEGEVRIFCSVVLVATDLLAVLVPDFVHGCAIGRAAVGDDELRVAIPFHSFL